VRIEGTDTDTGTDRVVEGPSPRSSSPATATWPPRVSRATAAGSLSWSRPTTAPSKSAAGGAMVEAVEAHRITVVDVE